MINSKKKIKNGSRYDLNGWIYISINGSPKKRGFAYGYLVADEMKQVFEMLNFTIYENFGQKWSYFIDASNTLFKDKIKEKFPEFYDEMLGFSEGCTAAGTKTSIDEIIAWNNYFTLTENWYPNKSTESNNNETRIRMGEGGGKSTTERCSAFIAVGDYTKDGKIIVGHNNFSEFVES